MSIEDIKNLIKESKEIEKFKSKVEGIYNYKVNFRDGKILEIYFDKFIKKEYSSYPSFKIYFDGKLLDFDDNGSSIYILTQKTLYE